MALTSQDFVKGIDITALTIVTGSEMNQLVDAGRTAHDKGLRLITTDSALNVPVVPNPNAVLEGVTPIWWKLYEWVRKPFDNTGTIIRYDWNELQNSDPTFLKWIAQNVDNNNIQAEIITLQQEDINLQNQINSNGAQTGVNTNNITSNTSSIQGLANAVTAAVLQVASALSNICPPGTLRYDASSIATAGWLLCNGGSYSRGSYPDLFARIGTTYGSVDGTSFNVPDIRSRSLMMAGQGTGLSLRNLGQIGGEETHLLTGLESGSKAHDHNITGLHHKVAVGFTIGGSNIVTLDGVDPVTSLITDPNVAVDSTNPHNNVHPFFVGNLYIKT